ncbi:unnamed protein product [Gongylonema pulchrum]|uniref:Reverse transcriptase domain-containing protein n=1 Tax=Gongylonema pulchrum TaxID=637853 RepID=A0A183CV71_9BILA|nr:unnamed protein product [Gongylonema pulchrum]
MGGNASPDVADLTLSLMEFRYIRRRPNTGLCFFRYNDDILATNCPDFPDRATEIYETALTLNATYFRRCDRFLDLAISLTDVESLMFTTKLWIIPSPSAKLATLIVMLTPLYMME